MKYVLQQQLLYCFTWSSNQLLNLNVLSLLFLQTFLVINSIPLCFDPPIFCYPLANLFLSFWLFCVLFWMLWMLVTVHKQYHVQHASQITTWATIFMERLFNVSKAWVRYWSHVFLITYYKCSLKSFGQSVQKREAKGKKKKIIRMAIAKLFAFNEDANAITKSIYFPNHVFL